jgi:hypothetical protein
MLRGADFQAQVGRRIIDFGADIQAQGGRGGKKQDQGNTPQFGIK